MENTSYIALSRQGVLRRQMDVIANNLANMTSTGFQAERMVFIDHLVRSRGGESLLGDKQAYVRDIATVRDMSEGSLERTHNPLDVAIHGDGYFAVETEAGERYTRSGHFRLDSSGQLVTQLGDPVLSATRQPFYFTPEDTQIHISRDGTVSTENGELGRLRVVSFEEPETMEPTSGGLYRSMETPVDVDRPDVVQGTLEESNVEPILELARMIEVNRAYSHAKNMVDAEDERIKKMMRALAVSSGA
jgi:flagellar basal-body rod protein FlgF